MPEENELQNNPHSLRILQGSIRIEVVTIQQQIRPMSKVISAGATPL